MSALPSFAGIAEEFRIPGQAVIQPERFAAALNLQFQELAQLAHVHRSTVSEAPANAKLQGFMRESLQVISAALEVAQDRDHAFYWYRNAPIPEFGHRTAEQLVADHKTEAVLAYLQSVRGGSSG
jgi:predicted XRE-type DNA-binding protein